PDRRVPARAADLQDLAAGLRRDEREQELPGRRRDCPRAPLLREPAGALIRILRGQAGEHGAYAIVEHALNPSEIGTLSRVEGSDPCHVRFGHAGRCGGPRQISTRTIPSTTRTG